MARKRSFLVSARDSKKPMRDYTKEQLAARKANIDANKPTNDGVGDPEGKFVVLEDSTTFHYGHERGSEYRRMEIAKREAALTDEEFAAFHDQPDHFKIEPPNLNVSHQDEEKGPKKGEEKDDPFVDILVDKMIDFPKK